MRVSGKTWEHQAGSACPTRAHRPDPTLPQSRAAPPHKPASPSPDTHLLRGRGAQGDQDHQGPPSTMHLTWVSLQSGEGPAVNLHTKHHRELIWGGHSGDPCPRWTPRTCQAEQRTSAVASSGPMARGQPWLSSAQGGHRGPSPRGPREPQHGEGWWGAELVSGGASCVPQPPDTQPGLLES